MSHEDIHWHHNQHNHPQYEWGIEGAQLIELRPDIILLNATCFLPHGPYGTRQRVFFAFATSPTGPYRSIGEVLPPLPGWQSGENGHATGIVEDNILYLFYQARSKDNEDVLANDWRYGLADFNIDTLIERLQMHA